MARGKKAQQAAETVKLIEALSFCAVAQHDIGQPYQSHIMLANRTAVAFDGILSAGTMTELPDVNTCPHTLKLIAALKKCKAEYSMTQTEGNQLVIKSGAFRAIIPCLPREEMTTGYPDNQIAPIDDRLKDGFKILDKIIVENAQTVLQSSVLLRANTMVATDRMLIVEFWHGIDLPPNLILPKAFVSAIAKSDKKLKWFGYSEHTVTFWFEDNSWIKTQLYVEQWPNIDAQWNFEPTLGPVPKKLREAAEAVAPFSENGALYLSEDLVASHPAEGVGATHDCPGLDFGDGLFPIFGIKRLYHMLDLAEQVDWNAKDGASYFVGNGCRGLISKRL
jgi:hypothetical protein